MNTMNFWGLSKDIYARSPVNKSSTAPVYNLWQTLAKVFVFQKLTCNSF